MDRPQSMETGSVVVEKTGGKSTVTGCFCKYPLKFIVPNKMGPRTSDSVWIYSLTYGGGIVSGDSIRCNFTVRDECTAVLTTQASTKVYKSVGSKCSEQILEKNELWCGRVKIWRSLRRNKHDGNPASRSLSG